MPPKRPLTFQQAAHARAALRHFDRQTDEICRRRGLTGAQYVLMIMVKGASGGDERTTVGELAVRLELSHNSVAERVQRAIESGLLVRERARHDGRVSVVTLTPEGDRRLQAAFDDLEEEAHRLMGVLAQAIEPRPA